jgi:hypothetical protein
MPKEATIVIHLVEESHEAANEEIEKDIRREAKIPWCKNIKKVTVVEQL